MTTLKDLIERVEKAAGSARGIDSDIERYFNLTNQLTCPAYTASVDAVIGLIGEKMPDHRWLVRSDEERGGFGNLAPIGSEYEREGLDYHPSYAPTPALALLLAFLRAWGGSNG